MFSTLQHLPAAPRASERRFYPRIVPQKPMYVSLTGESELLVLNLSENGLLVSTLAGFPRNFVARIAIPLEGFPKPVQVTARVVWTSKTRKLAGIQLLDLSEQDRQKIRNWGARMSAAPFPRERPAAAVTKAAIGALDERPSGNAFAEDVSPENPTTSRAVGAVDPALLTDATTGTVGKMRWPLFVTSLCLAGVFLLRSGALEGPFGLSRKPVDENKPVATPLINVQQTLLSAAAPEFNPAAAPVSGSIGTDATPTREPVPGTAAHAPANLGDAHGTLASHVAARLSQRAESRVKSTPSQSSGSPNALIPASTQADAQSDQPSSSTIADANPRSSADSSDVVELAPETTLPSAPPAEPEVLSSPTAPHEDATASIIAPNPRAPSPLAPQPPVIQMDVPSRQVIEVHLPRGNRNFFVNVPGERILQTSSATMHIQRSIRLPVTRSGMPVHGDQKIVVGALLSRVDPQIGPPGAAANDYVRVQATVAEDGHVENVRFTAGQYRLLAAVSNALRQWRYQSTLVGGRPVESACDVWLQLHAPTRQSTRAPASTTW